MIAPYKPSSRAHQGGRGGIAKGRLNVSESKFLGEHKQSQWMGRMNAVEMMCNWKVPLFLLLSMFFYTATDLKHRANKD